MSLRTCDDARVLLSDHLLDGVEGDGADALGSHLAACSPCRTHAGEIFLQDRILAEMGARARVDAMVGRLRGSIGGTKPLALTASGGTPVVVPRRRSWLPWVAAAAIFGAVAGVVAYLQPAPRVRPDVAGAGNATPDPVTHARKSPLPKPDAPQGPPLPPDPAPGPGPLVLPEKPRVDVKDPSPKPAPQPLPEPEPVKRADLPGAVAQGPAVHAVPPVIEVPRRTLDDSLRVGTAWLRGRASMLGAAQSGTGGRDMRPDELVLWTLLHSGVGEDDPDFYRLLKAMLERKLEGTYRAALQVMILEELDRVKYQPWIARGAQFLLDNQCRNGQWSYGDPSLFAEEATLPTLAARPSPAGGSKVKVFEAASAPGSRPKPRVVARIAVRKMREGPESGDNSNSMYAALGLRAAHDAGILLPPEVIQLAQKAWRDAQIRSAVAPAGEGWCYGGRSHGHKAYGSMTAGAVGSLAIYDYIRDNDEGKRGSWKRDAELLRGIDWLSRNFTVTENPGPTEHGDGKPDHMYYYYLYALERAATLNGLETIGKHDWYARGSQALLERQRLDGSWVATGAGELPDTCFALLFLRKATRALVDVPTGIRRK